MKLLVSIGLTLMLGCAGAFSYVWYQTNTTVDAAIKALAPYAHISYGSIVSSVYPGVLGLADVTIVLEGKRLHADSITFHAPDILDLYALQQNPNLFLVTHPRLKVTGLQSPVALRKLQLLQQPFHHPWLATLMTLDAAGCNGREEISHSDMRDMGYPGSSTDITLRSGPQQFNEGWELSLEARIRGVADYTMNAHYKTEPNSLPQIFSRLEQLDVNSITLGVKDQGYNPRLLEFCAGQSGMSLADYRQHHLRALQRRFERHSIPLEPDILLTYEEGLHRGARLQLQVRPQAEFAIDDLGFYDPADYSRLLGIRLVANNRAAGSSSGTRTAAAPPVTSAPAAEPPTTTSAPVKKQDVALDWAELQQALHEDILVYTASGGIHRGRLVSVDQQLLELKKQLGAGSFSYTIDRRRFDRAQRLDR